MEQGRALVRDVHPELVAEPAALLAGRGEHDPADLPLVAGCGCGDDFCRSLRTSDHPEGVPYGPGRRSVPLESSRGVVVLDVVDERIVHVEVLVRPGEPRHDVR
ncbi:hypothetical protein [Saccharothrix algeriensis]|uniref:Uncharacterized protein n=1 Tax=Saccharothrix algeriensis TaxID=173560 RepID=A0A8T8HT14_9PSEU|nr:hypothetical protein [Saccharothrix algeriensis]MBM7813096.1 hypothetical protein [Saccharothrix algeriensis]QTR01693.1 hypothetical protein J7S33_20520 [Saccharothrix algeriensis]